MARMYAKVKGSSLNSRIRADGKFRSNANINVDVDIEAISKIVYRDVMKSIKNDKNERTPKMDEVDVDSPAKKKGKQRKGWKTSQVGGSMIAMQAISSSVNLANAYFSGDKTLEEAVAVMQSRASIYVGEKAK